MSRLAWLCVAAPLLWSAGCTCGSDGGGGDPFDAAAVDAPATVPDAPDLGPCEPGGTCSGDAHCVGGRCVPWGSREYDPACRRDLEPGPIRPRLQCVWSGPPAGDPVAAATRVLHTPLVVDLKITTDVDTPSRPSVVFVSDASYTEGPPRGCAAAGTLRVIDGATCEEQAAATALEDRLNSPVTPAVGDLDLDGRPEVVAAGAAGGVLAFRWNPDTRALERLWASRLSDGTADLHGSGACLWGAISLYDLTDDGRPEVLLDGAVWSPEGVRLATVPGWAGYGWGVPAAVADVDGDGRAELLAGEGTWEWDGAAFVLEAGFVGSATRGFVAVADVGDFPGAAGDAPGRPEVVLVGGGRITVQSVGGSVVASLGAPSAGGGPPTVADYDGDGLAEIGAAFADHYVVHDPRANVLLWAQPSQDHSSSRTGSSVFDFNGDGAAEVVYGDECYVRIYDGADGEVVFSQARFSSTWEENPIVADVDADSAAEIVMGMSGPCSPTYCPPVDPLFRGLGCGEASDCPGGPCVEGLCRCGGDGECGATYGCAEPLPGTAGTGNVCRAFHRDCEPGLRVYRDARDRWAGSRRIWNQHAYHVTNVSEDGRVPRTSEADESWAVPGLNSFRQNVQGALGDLPGTDLTVADASAACGAAGAPATLSARVCNRGPAFVDAGIEVVFAQGGVALCTAATTEPLAPGGCAEVSCEAAGPPGAAPVDVVVDPEGAVTECLDTNNKLAEVLECVQ